MTEYYMLKVDGDMLDKIIAQELKIHRDIMADTLEKRKNGLIGPYFDINLADDIAMINERIHSLNLVLEFYTA
jgi:hypothetical protein